MENMNDTTLSLPLGMPPNPQFLPQPPAPPMPPPLPPMVTAIPPPGRHPHPRFNLGTALTAEGFVNTAKAQNNAAEWLIHQAVTSIEQALRPVYKDGKVAGARKLTPGEVLDVIYGAKSTLPGNSAAQNSGGPVVARPAMNGIPQAHRVVSARARAIRMLRSRGLYDRRNLARFLTWALSTQFGVLKTLPETQRKDVLGGGGVHTDAII
jgi:hypothetical protein